MKKFFLQRKARGFTLIELLIVIALIAVLAGAIIIALNPARQFALARNSERWSHVSSLNDLIQQNVAENRGSFTCGGVVTTIPTTSTLLASADNGTGGHFNICNCLVPTYTNSLPYDPNAAGAGYTDCTSFNTEYFIVRDAATSRITVSSTHAELGATISATR
jgi:prepilin-type N-terminal cleavage/methylation domain-containing protein